MQDFSVGGGGGLNFKISEILDIQGICYTAYIYICYEQQSCEPLLWGFGGMPPTRNFFKMVQFRAF